ncbi:MAG: acyl-CoA thioesterase [Bacteroidetes bacterium]|nr:acyl-CoA thioesterase [Bacteroidota bacterium]
MSFSKFTSEIPVRPDDIDMNNHVHFSRYLDYVLAARFEQMERDYRMSMEEFTARGLGWVVSGCTVQYKRPLVLGDVAIVKTGIVGLGTSSGKVGFEIIRKATGKLSADGIFDYTLVDIATGRAVPLTEEIIQRYSI